jgi:hypothetical protein
VPSCEAAPPIEGTEYHEALQQVGNLHLVVDPEVDVTWRYRIERVDAPTRTPDGDCAAHVSLTVEAPTAVIRTGIATSTLVLCSSGRATTPKLSLEGSNVASFTLTMTQQGVADVTARPTVVKATSPGRSTGTFAARTVTCSSKDKTVVTFRLTATGPPIPPGAPPGTSPTATYPFAIDPAPVAKSP